MILSDERKNKMGENYYLLDDMEKYQEGFNGRMILDKDGLWFEDEEGNLLRFNDFKIKC